MQLKQNIALRLKKRYAANLIRQEPILGWALDGNPIYGPHGYYNYKNGDEGFRRVRSGYLLRENRSEIIPGGETAGYGLVPPSEVTYPMGTFVEDYDYHPTYTDVDLLDLTTESGDDITTDSGLKIDVFTKDSSGSYTADLDANNGRICNTPEYPEELY